MYVHIPSVCDVLTLTKDWTFRLPKIEANKAYFDAAFPAEGAAWLDPDMDLNVTFLAGVDLCVFRVSVQGSRDRIEDRCVLFEVRDPYKPDNAQFVTVHIDDFNNIDFAPREPE